MRILHCIDTLGGGGAERQLAYLVEGLLRLGHEVDVVHLLDGVHGDRLRASGARMHALGWRQPADLRLAWELGGIIRRRHAEVVQTWLRRMDVYGGLAARLTGLPWVYSERWVRIRRRNWRQRLRHALGARAQAVVANSESGAALWRTPAGPPVHVVPNALALDEIAAAPAATRQDLGFAEDAEVVLFAARFSPEKNIALLGEALGILLARRPRAVALCCGEGPLRAPLEAQMAARGLSARVLAPGYREDLWSLMKLADVFVSTSLHEGRPNSVLEAMACGCPLALSDIAEHREFVSADAAFYFASHAAAEAAAALERALVDGARARAQAAVAKECVRAMSIDGMARRYQAIYSGLLRPPAAAGSRPGGACRATESPARR